MKGQLARRPYTFEAGRYDRYLLDTKPGANDVPSQSLGVICLLAPRSRAALIPLKGAVIKRMDGPTYGHVQTWTFSDGRKCKVVVQISTEQKLVQSGIVEPWASYFLEVENEFIGYLTMTHQGPLKVQCGPKRVQVRTHEETNQSIWKKVQAVIEKQTGLAISDRCPDHPLPVFCASEGEARDMANVFSALDTETPKWLERYTPPTWPFRPRSTLSGDSAYLPSMLDTRSYQAMRDDRKKDAEERRRLLHKMDASTKSEAVRECHRSVCPGASIPSDGKSVSTQCSIGCQHNYHLRCFRRDAVVLGSKCNAGPCSGQVCAIKHWNGKVLVRSEYATAYDTVSETNPTDDTMGAGSPGPVEFKESPVTGPAPVAIVPMERRDGRKGDAGPSSKPLATPTPVEPSSCTGPVLPRTDRPSAPLIKAPAEGNPPNRKRRSRNRKRGPRAINLVDLQVALVAAQKSGTAGDDSDVRLPADLRDVAPS